MPFHGQHAETYLRRGCFGAPRAAGNARGPVSADMRTGDGGERGGGATGFEPASSEMASRRTTSVLRPRPCGEHIHRRAPRPNRFSTRRPVSRAWTPRPAGSTGSGPGRVTAVPRPADPRGGEWRACRVTVPQDGDTRAVQRLARTAARGLGGPRPISSGIRGNLPRGELRGAARGVGRGPVPVQVGRGDGASVRLVVRSSFRRVHPNGPVVRSLTKHHLGSVIGRAMGQDPCRRQAPATAAGRSGRTPSPAAATDDWSTGSGSAGVEDPGSTGGPPTFVGPVALGVKPRQRPGVFV